MSSPVAIVAILAAYLYFVLSWGPTWMATRKPFELRNVMILYNSLQVVANLMLCITVSALKSKGFLKSVIASSFQAYYYSYYQPYYSFSCQDCAEPGTLLAELEMRLCYYYFVLKVVDLLDTVSAKWISLVIFKNFHSRFSLFCGRKMVKLRFCMCTIMLEW